MRNRIIKRFLACVSTVLVMYGVVAYAPQDTVVTPPATLPETEDDQSLQDTNTGDAPISISKFLAGFRCGGCRRNCSLLSPRCIEGQAKAETATLEYTELYSV